MVSKVLISVLSLSIFAFALLFFFAKTFFSLRKCLLEQSNLLPQTKQRLTLHKSRRASSSSQLPCERLKRGVQAVAALSHAFLPLCVMHPLESIVAARRKRLQIIKEMGGTFLESQFKKLFDVMNVCVRFHFVFGRGILPGCFTLIEQSCQRRLRDCYRRGKKGKLGLVWKHLHLSKALSPLPQLRALLCL